MTLITILDRINICIRLNYSELLLWYKLLSKSFKVKFLTIWNVRLYPAWDECFTFDVRLKIWYCILLLCPTDKLQLFRPLHNRLEKFYLAGALHSTIETCRFTHILYISLPYLENGAAWRCVLFLEISIALSWIVADAPLIFPLRCSVLSCLLWSWKRVILLRWEYVFCWCCRFWRFITSLTLLTTLLIRRRSSIITLFFIWETASQSIIVLLSETFFIIAHLLALLCRSLLLITVCNSCADGCSLYSRCLFVPHFPPLDDLLFIFVLPFNHSACLSKL